MANLEISQTERGSMKGSVSGFQAAVDQLDRTRRRSVVGKSRIGNVEAAFAKPRGFQYGAVEHDAFWTVPPARLSLR
jgi:hypothetical protein